MAGVYRISGARLFVGIFRGCCLVCTVIFALPALADLTDTIERIKPSMVSVGRYKAIASPQYTMRGTGFVVGRGNTVATNAHVVEGVAEDGAMVMVQVREAGERTSLRAAKVVAVDRDHDLAILRFEGPALPALPLGNADTVREGQAIAFTGFPIGAVLGFSPVTHRGIVSAITPIALPQSNSQQLSDAAIRRIKNGVFLIFQLDATAYPGNSGSPVFEPDTGTVIGVINMVFIKGSREAALSSPSGIAYAIPIRHLSELLGKQ